jgi:maltooligosyltrehalose synthase
VGEWSEGDEGRERMRALLERQHYVLDFWRAASRDINYRRFFDVNELIALKVEDAEVFDATHRTVLQFVADGLVDGLRIDHIDGLLEPQRYLERLRAAVDARRAPTDGARFPIVVEKILAPGESLPADWPVDGTTGYEFMTTLEDAFIDPAGYAQLEARYRTGRDGSDFHAVAYASKRAVLRNALNADVRRVAPMLASLARQAKWSAKPIAAYAALTQELEMHGPPAYFTPDWSSSKGSVAALAQLEPELAVTGHGRAVRGPQMREALHALASNFDQVAVPEHGRYVDGH